MIFVTVGSMMPFNRFIRAVDNWARGHPDHDILAQIGDGDYIPSHMRWARLLPRSEYRKAVEKSDIIVAHAGMGIISPRSRLESQLSCCLAMHL